MAKAIGFRAEPTTVHWAVVSTSAAGPILEDHGSIGAPKGYEEAAVLTWFRGRTANLINEHGVEAAAIKYTEPIARRGGADAARARCRLEGVILQLAHERGLRIFTGAFRALSGQLGSKSAKAYLDGDDVRGLDWSGVKPLPREAVLMALAALED
jgi:hypothetical protein